MSSDQVRVLRAPSLSEMVTSVDAVLAGGTPIAPLPADPVEAERAQRMLRPDRPVTEPDAAAIVATSGSTGVPKGVVLSRTALRASADATHQRLGGPGRWLLALPTHYVAGLMVVVRAVAAAQPVDDVGADLSGLATALDRAPDQRSYLSLVPTQLSRALADPMLTAGLARVDAVLLGGAPAAPDLLGAARDRGITVITTYGMSETCGGCVYDGEPLPGAEVSLTGGRIVIGGPMVFSGYRLRPDLTEQTLVDGRVRSNDRGSWEQGRLQVHGRFDDVVVSGGLKIDLAAVERAARDWPDLRGGEIALIGVPDPEWGTRLIAVAESVRAEEGLRFASLQAHLSTRVARHELPKELQVLTALPRTSSGKIDRRRLIDRSVNSSSTRRGIRGRSDGSADGELG